MSRLLRVFATSKAPAATLIYKSNDAFFASQCAFGSTKIRPNLAIVSQVMDARTLHGQKMAIRVEPDGCQTVVLRVASTDGGFLTIACTPPGTAGYPLKVGDLVAWVPIRQGAHKSLTDKRSAWVGFISARLDNQSANNELRILHDFTEQL